MDDFKLYSKTKTELEYLLNTVTIFSNDVNMEFGLEKCATLTIHRGKVNEHKSLNFPTNKPLRSSAWRKAMNTLAFSKQMISSTSK